MTKAELKKLTKKKLLSLAASKGLDVSASLLKKELINLLLNKGKAAKPPVKERKDKEKPAKQKTPVFNPPPKVETTEALIEARKFYEGPTSFPTPAEEPVIPQSYHRNFLAMVARDPYWSYAYWELTGEHIDANRSQLADPQSGKFILRIYQVADSLDDLSDIIRQWDIDLVGNPSNWYIHLGNADCSFVAEIGLLDAVGTFIALARSNCIHTPRDSMSEVIDEEWMTIEENFEKLYRLSGGFDINRSSAGITELLAKRWQFDVSSGGISSFRSGRHPSRG